MVKCLSVHRLRVLEERAREIDPESKVARLLRAIVTNDRATALYIAHNPRTERRKLHR